MTATTDPAVDILHLLRVKGQASEEALAAHTGLGRPVIEMQLALLADERLVGRRDGTQAAWSLTDDGRVAHAERCSAQLTGAGRRESIAEANQLFLPVNDGLLAACTAWQLRPVGGRDIPNDHTDGRYDAAVIARLHDLHGAARPICGRLAATLARYGGYWDRLTTALRRVDAGECEWFTSPRLDSYHTAWFELHEDLLVTLGIPRSGRTSSSSSARPGQDADTAPDSSEAAQAYSCRER